MKKGVTLEAVCDQDWKTQLVQKYPNIPPFTIVDVINEDFHNFYGEWYEVMWNDRHYYVPKNSISLNPLEIKMYNDKNESN